MSFSVCLGTSNTLRYPQGGHLWVFINWALGFRAAGAERIIWLDVIDPARSPDQTLASLELLRERIAAFGLAETIALIRPDGSPVGFDTGTLGVEEASGAQLLFDLRYDLPESLVRRFRRSALLDIDPGLLQFAMQKGHMNPAAHDVYFTIGQSVGTLGSRFPSLGLDWIHVPPCVSLEHWPMIPPPAAGQGAYTTVSHWYMNEWMADEDGTVYKNDKRSAFLPYVQLPQRVEAKLELAIHLAGDSVERAMLESHGWQVREAHEAAGSPLDFQRYVQSSRGEFGCAKPAYVKLKTGWISDRTICYLACGRPAIIQDTGPIGYFEGGQGVLRFSTFEQAIECVQAVERDYAAHCAAARALAEEYFDARKVAARVLDRCI
ncbi:hypothetical protein [Fontivita pretiosa]|uniref:hypothetical protein n=1 Tax=Fontivita pretiosa TaxID=2989684 RepID=UPI003D181910